MLLLVLPELILALPSAGGADHLLKWIDQFVFLEDVALAESEGRAEVFSFLGPGAPDLVRHVFGIHPAAGSFQERQIGRPRVFVVMGDGSTRVDCIVTGQRGEPFALPDAGIVPRLEERMYTTYRTLTGIPAYGHELSESYNPLEVGLGSTINFMKGCYTGQEVIA